MQISIEQETLAKAISHVMGVVDKRGTLPILSHCLLQTDNNGVFVSATDLEIGFRGFYPADITKPGDLTVPADFFNKLIKDLPKGPLALARTDNHCLKIRTGDSRYRLNGLPADQFPPIAESAGENLVDVDGHLLKEMVSKTIFATTGNEQQYHLRAICWESFERDEGNWWLRLVSTNGHRLCLVERPLPEGRHLDLGKGILVPYKGVREICRFVEGQGKVTLEVGEKTLSVQAVDKHLSVRLLDSKFPDYRRIIREGFVYQFSIKRLELADILKRMSQLSTERFKGMILKLSGGSAQITHANPEVGEGQEQLPVELEAGNASQLPLELGFNAAYLLEPLQAMSSDKVLLDLNDGESPFRLSDQGDPHYFNMIMPTSPC